MNHCDLSATLPGVRTVFEGPISGVPHVASRVSAFAVAIDVNGKAEHRESGLAITTGPAD